ncbi:MAG: 50S ribosomal protein L32 [Chloroflexi bacterium]|nr:50S ribosomal protein L32 [Chloroflexota bacterium]
MPPLPKRKSSRAKRGHSSSHYKMKLKSLVPCPQCRSPKLPHHVCPHCGYYRGRAVIPVEDKEKASS